MQSRQWFLLRVRRLRYTLSSELVWRTHVENMIGRFLMAFVATRKIT